MCKTVSLIVLFVLLLSSACALDTIEGQVKDKWIENGTHRVKLESQTISVTPTVFAYVLVGNHYVFEREDQGPYAVVKLDVVALMETRE